MTGCRHSGPRGRRAGAGGAAHIRVLPLPAQARSCLCGITCLCPALGLLTTRRGRFCVDADLEMRATLPVPQACPNQRGCRGTSFLHIESLRILTDYQEVRSARAPSALLH